MGNWDRPPFDPQQQQQQQQPERFHPRIPMGPGPGPMNRPFFQPPHLQDRFNQGGPIPPPRGRQT